MSHHGFVSSSNNYPENDICVVKSGEYYRDSYIPIKYENQTRKMLEEIATELVGDDYYIVLDVSNDVISVDANVSFEDYIALKYNNLSFAIYTSNGLDKEEKNNLKIDKKLASI